MSNLEDIVKSLELLTQVIKELDTSALATPKLKRALLELKTPIALKRGQWTSIPMTFSSGDTSLRRNDGFVQGLPGYWLWAAYLRFAPASKGQGIIQFVRDIGGKEDSTGAQDWVTTPGKDFVSHVWPFKPLVGKPVGIKVYSSMGDDIILEYAQLKPVQLSTY